MSDSMAAPDLRALAEEATPSRQWLVRLVASLQKRGASCSEFSVAEVARLLSENAALLDRTERAEKALQVWIRASDAMEATREYGSVSEHTLQPLRDAEEALKRVARAASPPPKESHNG